MSISGLNNKKQRKGALPMTYKEALEEHRLMVEFRDKHYTDTGKPDISKEDKPAEIETEEPSEFHFFEA